MEEGGIKNLRYNLSRWIDQSGEQIKMDDLAML